MRRRPDRTARRRAGRPAPDGAAGVRRQAGAAIRRGELAALRVLAETRHPGNPRAQRAFLRRFHGASVWPARRVLLRRGDDLDSEVLLTLTPEETERGQVVSGLARLALVARWMVAPAGDAKAQHAAEILRPRLLALITRARRLIAGGHWPEARRAWQEAEGFEQLWTDHRTEIELTRLRPFSAVRVAQPRATLARRTSAAKRRQQWAPRLRDLASEAPKMMTTRNSIVNWVHAQLTAGEESDEQTEVPSKSSISRWLPPMREIRPSALRRAQGKKA